MNANPGDLVVCIDDGPSRYSDYGVGNLKRGVTYRVLLATMEPYGLCLLVDGAASEHPSGEYRATRFRKVLPDEPTACEEEFRILLKLSKQRVSA